MEFHKTALTFDQQIELLESRGMQIPDKELAQHYLSHLNYYRLAAYWLPYEASRKPHQFAAGTTFDLVLNHYLFDREFRLLLLDAIERIEVSFRTQWAYHLSRKFGAHGYLINSRGLRKDEGRLMSVIGQLKEEVARSDEVFVKHYRDKYSEDLPPAWVSCELMSLGLLSRFYSNLNAYAVRREIAKTYDFDETFLEGFMEHLTYVRNVCAHHSRIWNRHLTKKMPLPRNKPKDLSANIYIDSENKTEHKIYNTLVVIQHLMLLVSPGTGWSDRLKTLIAEHSIQVERMGFPSNWQQLPIWR